MRRPRTTHTHTQASSHAHACEHTHGCTPPSTNGGTYTGGPHLEVVHEPGVVELVLLCVHRLGVDDHLAVSLGVDLGPATGVATGQPVCGWSPCYLKIHFCSISDRGNSELMNAWLGREQTRIPKQPLRQPSVTVTLSTASQPP